TNTVEKVEHHTRAERDHRGQTVSTEIRASGHRYRQPALQDGLGGSSEIQIQPGEAAVRGRLHLRSARRSAGTLHRRGEGPGMQSNPVLRLLAVGRSPAFPCGDGREVAGYRPCCSTEQDLSPA